MTRATRRAILAAIAAAALGAVVLSDPALRAGWREAATDRLLLASGGPPGGVKVVDIDRASLAEAGSWPWPRDRLARLVANAMASGARVVTVDILLEQPLEGDTSLGTFLAGQPTVLGALLSDEVRGSSLAPAPVAVIGDPPQLAPWTAASIRTPAPALIANAEAIGVSSMAADADGLVRRVSLFAVGSGEVVAGLAAQTARLSQAAGNFLIDGEAMSVRIGDLRVPLTHEADMRFLPSPEASWPARTVPARALLAGTVPALSGQVVLIGGSAPELGALRQTAASPVTPAVQIQADAVATILGGRVPLRPEWAPLVEGIAGLTLAGAGAAAGVLAEPGLAALIIGGIALGWVAVGALLIAGAMILIDPATPAVFPLLAGSAAAITTAATARIAARALRRRFEQYLAPEIVARIAGQPGLVKLAGERRVITALVTDVEDFTALADRIEPEDLVRLLDAYFEVVIGIVTAHGGMVDKIIGDAVHALFNAPLDLPDHTGRAIDAARALVAATEAFRATHPVLGRTRVGIESGLCVVGDVGARGKLDYTAYGTAVNTAARLEAINKLTGSAVCVGPKARALCPSRRFRSLGEIEVRGRGPLELFEPLE